MLDAFAITGRSFKDLWSDFPFLILLNVLWVASAVLAAAPVFGLAGSSPVLIWALTLLLGLLLPVLSGAICFVTNQITHGVAVNWGTFFTGVRRYWAKSLLVALVNVVVLILVGANLRFYAVVLQGTWTNLALSVWLVLGIYWLLVQLFWFPMLLELKDEKVFVALRNAAVMVLITPWFTLMLGVIVLVLSVVSIVLTVPAAFLLATVLLLISNHATRSRVARIQKKPYKPGVPEE